MTRRGGGHARLVTRAFCLAAALGLASFSSVGAHAETRTLKLLFTHTGERAEITYKRNGQYVDSGLKQANKILRDFRRNEPTKMDPRLLDLVWEVYQQSGSKGYINVISGYRSPATNGMLRSRGRGVAKHSQHMLGKAMDFFLTDVKLSKLREIGLKMGVGGVGFYPTSGSPFVHLDTGNVRHWPKMSRQELARIFPDGKTLHVPSDGKPLPKYDQALAEYKAKGRTSAVTLASAEEVKKPGFFQRLAAKAQEDQADDEGFDPVPGVTTRKTAPVLTAAAVAKPAPAAEPLEGDVDVPAPPKVAAGRTPVPAAEVGAQPANVPVPQDPQRDGDPASGEPFEVASAEAPPAEDGAIPFDRVPVPERRPQAPVLAFAAATPQQRPAEGQVVAALTPDEIENLRKTAVPNPATADIPVTQLALVQAPVEASASAAATQIALAEPSKKAAPAAVASTAPAANKVPDATAAIAKPREQSLAVAAASQASGPSRKTLELALASTSENDSEATRAIRDLIDAANNPATPIAEAGTGSASTGAIPVPQPDPRATRMASSKPAAKPAAQSAAAKEKVGRYALASSANIGKVKEISAPGYAVGTQDSQLIVASFGQSLGQTVTGKFAPQTVAKLPALTVRTN